MKKRPLWILAVAGLVSIETFAEQSRGCEIRGSRDTNQATFKSCWYSGIGYGLSHLNPDANNTTWDITGKDDVGWLVYGGYHFKPKWFAEFAYHDMGEVSANDRNPVRNASGSISYKVPTLMAGYYFDLPSLTNHVIPELPFDTFVKLGVAAIDNDASPSIIPLDQRSNVQLALGVGAEWRFHQNWKVRTQYESFDIDAQSLNFSVIYIFGGSEKTTRVEPRVMEEAKKVQEKVFTPVKTEVSEPAKFVEVKRAEVKVDRALDKKACEMFSGSLEGVYFKSGSDQLAEESKAILLETIELLKKYSNLRIEVQAHTDWQGSAVTNQVLSDKRAASVKDYMALNGVSEGRVRSVGYGETQPMADNNSSEGRAKNRRVELEAIDKTECNVSGRDDIGS